MLHHRFLAVLVTGVALGFSALAHAQIIDPPPGNSIIPCGIRLVGRNGTVADPIGQFTVVVRDLANNPVPNADVVVDFTPCMPDIQIARDDAQYWPNMTEDCNTHMVHQQTNAVGNATFRIIGAAHNPGPPAGYKCGRIYADGVLLGSVTVAAFDENGSIGVSAVDLSGWLSDFFGNLTAGRSDFDCTSTLGASDLSAWLAAFFASGSTQSAAAFCNP